MTGRRATILAAAFAAMATGGVHAQEVALSAMGAAAQPRSTVVLPEGMERVAGIWVGGVIDLELGALTITGRGFRGTLQAIDNTVALDRDAGEVGGEVEIHPVRWLGLGGGYTVRAFSSAAGYQRWDIQSVGASLSGALGHPALTAYVRGAYLTSITVSGIESPDLGVAASAGLTIAPAKLPIALKVEYRLERYDFSAGTATRIEQFDLVSIAVGLRRATGLQ